jgi:hypothetical protein
MAPLLIVFSQVLCTSLHGQPLPQGASAASEAAPQAPSATLAPAAPTVEQSFVGTNQCFACHRPQTNSWSETKHAQAFTHLPEAYRSDEACLKCHVTAFGEANGFVAGTEKDLLMVGCESCHGPGARHIDAAKRFVLAMPGEEEQIQKEMKETIRRTPSDSVCASCHITQAHGTHPEYGETLPGPRDGRKAQGSGFAYHCDPRLLATHSSPSASGRVAYAAGYSVKTCGSCHYDQYQHARVETHFALDAELPHKYLHDEECQKCHVSSGGVAARLVASDSAQQNLVGAACEICHGPALEHVRFNVRFIHRAPLGPQLEQAARDSIRKRKPDALCTQCHLGVSHKEHPSFETNEISTPSSDSSSNN